MNFVIGLTGPTGSGKSISACICEKYGIKVVDCDKIARKATEKGTKGLLALTQVFGKDILNEDKTLNRKKLAQKAFSSSQNTQLLNQTIFPFIKDLVFEQINGGVVLLDAPTLFESGINEICFKTIAVLSDKNKRLERIILRDNLSDSDAILRISAGKNDNFYKQKADYILYNNGEKETFLKEFEEILLKILNLGEKV